MSGAGGLTNAYSATLIKGMGYGSKQVALINMPAGLVTISFSLVAGYGVRRGSHRWAWILACIIPGYVSHQVSPASELTRRSILGAGLMSFLPKDNRTGILAGIYLVHAVGSSIPIFSNVSFYVVLVTFK